MRTLTEDLVAQLDHHISTSREQRNAAKRCATLKEELVAGDLPILAVPFTTAMLSLGKKQMITYKSTFSSREKKKNKKLLLQPWGLAAELVEDVWAATEDVGAISHRTTQVDARVRPLRGKGMKKASRESKKRKKNR